MAAVRVWTRSDLARHDLAPARLPRRLLDNHLPSRLGPHIFGGDQMLERKDLPPYREQREHSFSVKEPLRLTIDFEDAVFQLN